MSLVTLDLDKDLLEEALRISGLSTYEEVIHLALREFLRVHQARTADEAPPPGNEGVWGKPPPE